MFWQISFFPRCEYHVFLSHCALDRKRLVYPAYEELKRRNIIPWLDREDYYFGRGSRVALRDALMMCRHAVFFVTPAMMAYTRGWCPMELGYADLLQANLVHSGGNLSNLTLPLFFLSRSDRSASMKLNRTVWGMLRDTGRFHRPRDGDRVQWAAAQIQAFLRREQALALHMGRGILPGHPVHDEFGKRPGLLERVTSFDPGPIP
jgi:hypothetical protein